MLIDLAVFFINFYKKNISPKLRKRGIYCIYIPTCSTYAIESIKKNGLVLGICMGILRILRCNKFSKGGFDLVK